VRLFARENWPLLVSAGIAFVALAIFTVFLKWDSLTFSVKISDLSGLLAPLAVAAAIIERAVEILVSPWRDTEASKLEKKVASIKARTSNAPTNAQDTVDLQAASDALDEYRGKTKKYAFAVSLILSVFVSITGIRALQGFIDSAKLHNAAIVAHSQQIFFLCIDVALSAALLAGGADGIHSVVNAITSFFQASADKTKV
jgi:hypothetical protein